MKWLEKGTFRGWDKNMMRQFVSAVCGIWIGCAGPLAAQTPPAVVVELFTSQGCSSCPPADEFFASLTKDPTVIALALHVDYWDYIGWEDQFASPQFTERQKAYAHAQNTKTIYTPQFIVGGEGRVVGHLPEDVKAQLSGQRQFDNPITLWVQRDGDQVVIRAEADPPLGQAVRVQLVRYMPSSTVDIERGENAGHSITYRNIVTSWANLGAWTGAEPFATTAPAKGDEPIVVIVQIEGPGRILAAARID